MNRKREVKWHTSFTNQVTKGEELSEEYNVPHAVILLKLDKPRPNKMLHEPPEGDQAKGTNIPSIVKTL
jgi:hypothetical protein